MSQDASPPDRFPLSRRQMMIAAAVGGLGVLGTASGLDKDGQSGKLNAGRMDLDQAYNVAGNLYVGPDSAKSGISADSGRMYFANDTQLTYYGDGGSWVSLGVGTDGNPAPASHFQSVTADELNNVIYASENLPGVQSIASAIDEAENNAPAIVAVVDPGTHTVSLTENSAALYWATSDVHLYLGRGVTIKMADAEHTNSEGHVVRIGTGTQTLSDISIFGPGTIDGNRTNNSASNLANGTAVRVEAEIDNFRLEGVTINSAPGDAFRLDGNGVGSEATNCVVKDVTSEDCLEGFLATDVDGITFTNIDLKGVINAQDGIEPFGNANNILIQGCVLDMGGNGNAGVDIFDGASQVTVTDTKIKNWATGYAISIGGSACSEIEITDSVVIEDASGGAGAIQLDANAHDNVKISATIRNAGVPITIDGSVVRSSVIGADIYDCDGVLQLGGTECVMEGCTLHNVGTGKTNCVSVGTSTHVDVRSNTITHPAVNPPTNGLNLGSNPTAGVTENNSISGDFTTKINGTGADGHHVYDSGDVAAVAYLSADKTIPNASITRIPIDAVDFEDTKVVSVDTSNNQMIAEQDGKFLVTIHAEWSASADWTDGDRCDIRTAVGGSRTVARTAYHNGVNDIFAVEHTIILDLSQGDSIEPEAFQNTGGNETLAGGSTDRTSMRVAYLGGGR